jgi:hypothetical protein
MWYTIIIVIIVFQLAVSAIAPYFAMTATNELSYITANSTASMQVISANPFSVLFHILTFQMSGFEWIPVVFMLLDILLVICVIKLVNLNFTVVV